MSTLRLLFIIALSVPLACCTPAFGQARSAAEILADYDALVAPTMDRGQSANPAVTAKYRQAQREFLLGRAALALELHTAAPEHERATQLMRDRWCTMSRIGEADGLRPELQAISSSESELATDAAYYLALVTGQATSWDGEECLPLIEAFIKRVPDDERGASLLAMAAERAGEPEQKLGLYQRLVRDYPDARVTEYARGKIRQTEGIGKPFELEFEDAIQGGTVSIQSRKGTIFVVDFWATWCGPCVQGMPHMKELYAAYKDQGVEFLGVSLDQPEDKGGLDRLRMFVEQNQIAWPQYYQGNYWQSEFSSGWGINSIPCVFVVDAEGNLFSNDARGKLEQILPALIAARQTTP